MSEPKEYRGYADGKDTSALRGRNGVPLTSSLFVERDGQWADIKEQRKAEGKWTHEPIYTLGEKPKDGLLSAYQIYMNSVDEYEAAMKLVGSIFHWQELCKKEWFMEHVRQWREHMVHRDFSLAKKTTLSEVMMGDGPAARHLLNFSHKVINPPEAKKKKKPKGEKTPEEQAEGDAELDKIYQEHMTDGVINKAGTAPKPL